jgi:hypothetical protein
MTTLKGTVQQVTSPAQRRQACRAGRSAILLGVVGVVLAVTGIATVTRTASYLAGPPTGEHLARRYFRTDTKVDALLLGCVLTLVLASDAPQARWFGRLPFRVVGVASLVALLAVVPWLRPTPVGYTAQVSVFRLALGWSPLRPRGRKGAVVAGGGVQRVLASHDWRSLVLAVSPAPADIHPGPAPARPIAGQPGGGGAHHPRARRWLLPPRRAALPPGSGAAAEHQAGAERPGEFAVLAEADATKGST